MDEKTLKRYYLTHIIIWAAMVVSVIIYLVVGKLFLAKTIDFTKAPDVTTLRYLFAAVSLAVPMLNIWFMKRVLGSDRYENATGVEALSPFATVNVFTLAMSELVAVFGFALYIMAGDEFDLYAFIALSLVYLFIFMPKYSVLRNWAVHKKLLADDRSKDPGARGYRK